MSYRTNSYSKSKARAETTWNHKRPLDVKHISGVLESGVEFAERLFRNLSANSTEIPKDPYREAPRFPRDLLQLCAAMPARKYVII